MESPTNSSMTKEQSESLSQIVMGRSNLSLALTIKAKTDKFEAHSILSYVLSHNMSPESDRNYVITKLKLSVSEVKVGGEHEEAIP